MINTALRAEETKREQITFISEAHAKFYYEKLREVRYRDVYHKALIYCLGISNDTRRNINNIYDFEKVYILMIDGDYYATIRRNNGTYQGLSE